MARLRDVCTFFSGTGFPNQYQGNRNGKYPFFKVGDISKNVQMGYQILQHCDNYIDDEIVAAIRGVILPKGTIVFAKIGEALRLNRRAITPCECLVDNNVMGIKPCDERLSIAYFYYFMTAIDLQKYCETTTVPSVRKTTLEKVEINLPPIVVQEKTASVLGKIDDLISLRKQELAKLDELAKARFVEMFGDPVSNPMGWELSPLNDVTSKIGSGATPKGGKESYQANGITLIRSMNVHDGYFEYKELAHISDSQAEQLSNVEVCTDDVFINITGASVARSCIVPIDVLPARVNQHVSIIRCKRSELNCVFVNQQFLNPSFKKKLLGLGEAGGATRQAITKQQLEDLNVIIPPLGLQEKFAVFCRKTEEQKLTIQQSLDKLEVLKKSLMQEYFG